MTPLLLSPDSADALLFDLGRVVLDIDFNKTILCWAGHAGCAPSDIVERFVRDEAYRHHEIGKISDEAYFDSLRASLDVELSDAQFLEGWNAIFAGEMPGIAPLLARAARRLPLYAFSNTNTPHVEHFSKAYAGLLGHFREVYLSSAIGLRKPDAAALIMSSTRSARRPRASCSLTISPRMLKAPGPGDFWPFRSNLPPTSPQHSTRSGFNSSQIGKASPSLPATNAKRLRMGALRSQ